MEKDLRACDGKKQVPDPSSISALNHLNEDYCFPVTNIALSETVKDWFEPEVVQKQPEVLELEPKMSRK